MRPYDQQGDDDRHPDAYEAALVRPDVPYDDTVGIGVSGDSGSTSDTEDVEGTAEIRAEIEQTRSGMSETINAIQDKLNPQVLMDQAKDTLHEATADVLAQAKETVIDTTSDIVEQTKDTVREATVGRVEDMVTTASNTAKEAGSNIVDLVKQNPLPAALVGLSLGWLFTRGQGSSGSYRYPSYQDYGYGNYGPGYPLRMAGGMPYQPRDMAGQVVNTIRQNPVPTALAGAGAAWLLNNRGGASPTADYNPEGGYGYGSGSYEEQSSIGDTVGRAQDKVGEVAGQVGDKVGDFADQAQQTAGDVAGRVGDTAGYVAEQTGDIAGQVLRTIKANPIPAALAGLSLGWLFMNGQGGSSQGQSRSRYGSSSTRYDYNYDAEYRSRSRGGDTLGDTIGDTAGRAGEKVGDIADQVGTTVGRAGEKVGDMAGQVGSTVGDVAGQVGQTAGDVAGNVRDTVGDFAGGVQHQARRLPSQVERLLNESPLAVGAAAIALGATVGLLVPETEQEHKLMGATRDNFMGKAQNVAEDAMGKAQTVAEDAMDKVKQVAEQTGDAIQHEVRN